MYVSCSKIITISSEEKRFSNKKIRMCDLQYFWLDNVIVTYSDIAYNSSYQGEKECPHYRRNGSCKYGLNCWFDHPEPSSMGGGFTLSYYTGLEGTVPYWSSAGPTNDIGLFEPPHMYQPTQCAPYPQWIGYQVFSSTQKIFHCIVQGLDCLCGISQLDKLSFQCLVLLRINQSDTNYIPPLPPSSAMLMPNSMPSVKWSLKFDVNDISSYKFDELFHFFFLFLYALDVGQSLCLQSFSSKLIKEKTNSTHALSFGALRWLHTRNVGCFYFFVESNLFHI